MADSYLKDKKRVLPIINSLVEKGVLQLQEELYEKYQPKLVRYVKLHHNHKSQENLQNLLEELSRAPKQREVILTLFTLEATSKLPIKVSELVERSGASTATIKTLIDKTILEDYHIRKDRIQFEGEGDAEAKQLSDAQQEAFEALETNFEAKSVSVTVGAMALTLIVGANSAPRDFVKPSTAALEAVTLA